MDKNFWLDSWQQGQIGFNQAYANAYMIKYFPRLGLSPHSTIFVPLCGKSIDMLWLLQQGFHVIGIELSLLAGEAFFKENNLTYSKKLEYGMTVLKGEHIDLYIGDFFQLPAKALKHIHAIYDRAALIALPEDLRKTYVAYLRSILPKPIPALLIALTYSKHHMQGPPFSVAESEIRQLFNHCHIEKLHDVVAKTIPAHLSDKGLIEATNQVYYIDCVI